MESHGLDEVTTEKVEPWVPSQVYKEELARKPTEGVSKRWGKLGVLKAAETMRKRRWDSDQAPRGIASVMGTLSV